ncbi:hypothetical protein [Hyphomonas sp.]|uniref:hypothetical protein n=1 Tax=Hyphomonas sp. TaxID=87 RepID=UPI0025BE3E25|nr:hypothetical protein [Hyphomonas sp.]
MTPAEAMERVYLAVRRLQALMRAKIDPEGSMTPEQFEDRALAVIDDGELNDALEALHAEGFDADTLEIDPEEPFEPDWDRQSLH